MAAKLAFYVRSRTFQSLSQSHSVGSSHSAAACTCLQCKTVGSYQMFPRKFWMMLMGGLTVLEALLLASWITLNVVMLWNWYYYYEEPYNYGKPLPLALGAGNAPARSHLSHVPVCVEERCIESQFTESGACLYFCFVLLRHVCMVCLIPASASQSLHKPQLLKLW